MVLIPTNTQVYPFLAPHQGLDLERPNRILGAFLKAQGIDYLDLLPLMRTYADEQPRPSLNPDRDLYWQHNSHWSIRGEHLVGLLVSRYILEHRLVQVPDGATKLKNIEAEISQLALRARLRGEIAPLSLQQSLTSSPVRIPMRPAPYFQTPSISAWHLGQRPSLRW